MFAGRPRKVVILVSTFKKYVFIQFEYVSMTHVQRATELRVLFSGNRNAFTAIHIIVKIWLKENVLLRWGKIVKYVKKRNS